ncbi:hypothetical protein FACS1894214_3910 [Planctomycetales bacterium]|nr:hypothetical protein FACS1894214_3910 [Planctomycetales bacterium]
MILPEPMIVYIATHTGEALFTATLFIVFCFADAVERRGDDNFDVVYYVAVVLWCYGRCTDAEVAGSETCCCKAVREAVSLKGNGSIGDGGVGWCGNGRRG